MTGTIVSITAIAAILLALRPATGKRIDPRMQYALWGLIPLRLIAFGASWLIALPQSRLSIMNAAQAAATSAREAVVLRAPQLAPLLQGTIAADGGASQGLASEAMESGTWVGLYSQLATFFAGDTWKAILLCLWLVGLVVLLLWFGAVNLRFQRHLRCGERLLTDQERGRIEDDWARSGISAKQRIPVHVCADLSSPCLVGLGRNSRIWIPELLLTDEDSLRYALLHEYCHLRQGDVLWSVLRSLTLAVLWFHPLVWLAARASRQDCELACDAAVIQRIGQEERLLYGRTLLKLIKVSPEKGKTQIFCAATTMCENDRGIRERILHIASPHQMAAVAMAGMVLVGVLIAGCTFTQAADDHGVTGDNGSPAGNAPGVVQTSPMPQEGMELLEQWAQAYAARDGRTIESLCDDDKLYLTIGEKHLQEDGTWGYSMGLSSPWPWDDDYGITVRSATQADIYYYFRTSTSVSLSRESLTLTYKDGTAKVTESQWKHFDTVASAADFDESYGYMGVLNLEAYVPFYQSEAEATARGEFTGIRDGSVYTKPDLAALEQLYIQGAQTEVQLQEDGTALVFFHWPDGQRGVEMVPYGDIWIPDPTTYHSVIAVYDDLDHAVKRSVLDANRDFTQQGGRYFNAESHVILGTESGNSPGTEGLLTVYAMVMHQRYVNENGTLETVAGCHMPVALTFQTDVTAENGEPGYLLKDYWIPGDGSQYVSSIRERFPEKLWKQAIDTQATVEQQEKECLAQAKEYFNI